MTDLEALTEAYERDRKTTRFLIWCVCQLPR
jgi:hypothetical protein